MPDTLLTVLISMCYFIFLAYLPKAIWAANKGINPYDFIKIRNNIPYNTLRAELALLAFKNFKETYPIFLALSVLGITMGIPIHVSTFIWLLLRIFYTPCYIFEWNIAKSLSWHLSILCLFWMALEIIRLNRLTMFTNF